MLKNGFDDKHGNYDDYGDELDRMRARRHKKEQYTQRTTNHSRRTQYYDLEDEAEEDSYISQEFDPDFQFFDMQQDDDLTRKPKQYRNMAYNNTNYPNKRFQRPEHGRQEKQIHSQTAHSQQAAKQKRHSSVRSSVRKTKVRKKRHGFKILLLGILLISAVLYGKRWMKDRDGYWNIAVFGVDARDNNKLEKGTLADVQMIASINKKTGEIRLVSIFRDTYVQINADGEFHKINEAYLKGGHEQAVETLKRNFDIQVDDYATFNWKAVADAINILGGIDLEITDSEFRYINSFITATVESTGIYSTHLEHAGWNHLDGVQAVAYSRLRLMDTDFNRTERQRKVVSLAMEKAKEADFQTLSTIVGTVIPEISTSIGIEDVIPLAKDVKRYHLGQSGGFPFAKTTADIGKLDCVIPMTLESNVVILHQFLFDTENFQPSASVKSISSKISERTGIYEEGKVTGPDKNLSGTTNNPSPNPDPPSDHTAQAEEKEPENGAAVDFEPTEASDESETSAESIPSETEQDKQDDRQDDGNTKETTGEITTIEESNGISEPSSTIIDKEPTLSDDQIHQGPGSVNPTVSTDYTKPAETTAEAYGPGFE